MRRIRTYGQVGDAGGGDIEVQVGVLEERLRSRLAAVAHVVAVASGKGGVGKSFITANLAAALVRRGRRVGVVDADLNGPTAALMLGAARTPLPVSDDGVLPATTAAGCSLMSMDLLLATADSAVRWREPAQGGFVWQSTLETGALREFIADTAWGPLDYLLVDLPPGTDRIARLLALVGAPAVLLLISTPSAAASGVVARSVTHARDAGVRDIAIVSNMDGLVCAGCGRTTPLFGAGEADTLAARMDVPSWGRVPFDSSAGADTDRGRPATTSAPHSPAARAIEEIASALERHVGIGISSTAAP